MNILSLISIRLGTVYQMAIGGNELCGIVLAILIVSILGLSPLTSFAQAEDESPNVFSPDSEPYGMTYAEWTAEWWKWFISIPADQNPINDPTGEGCAVAQSGQVWFLVGSGGGKTERECTIPAGKAILIPAINVECAFSEDESLKTEDDLRACAKNDQDLVTQFGATLNGMDAQVHRVQSPVFDITFPADNVFAVPEGPTQSISEGYWAFFKPLPPGEYDIHAEGLLVDYTVTGPVNLVEDSTYHLTVETPPTFVVVSETVMVADESVPVSLGSTSDVTDITFDEEAKQLSFKVTGEDGTEGMTTVQISSLLEGPYTVMIDGTATTNYGTYTNEAGDTTVTLVYNHSTHDVAIAGTNVVPEFPYSILILLAAISAIVVLGKTRIVNNRI
jgi:hypothetical protein